MRPIAPVEAAPLLSYWLRPDQPRHLAAWHVLMTGNGVCFVDRLPEPRGVLVTCGTNYALLGEPDAFSPDDLRGELDGFLDAPDAHVPLLRAAFSSLTSWPRVNLVQTKPPPAVSAVDAEVRRLTSGDAHHVWSLSPESAWITTTWGGPPGLVASGAAWGAFQDNRLVSLACTFYVAERFEDIGIVTLPEYRGQGLSPACTARLCAEIHARGRLPTWGTSNDNAASLRVAEKLGFSVDHHDTLWVIGRPPPQPADYP